MKIPRAFTLVEVMIAVAILAFAVAAIAQAISAGHAQTHASLHDLRAVSLAEALLEEVLSKPYADPDGVDGETARTDFDDADDYDGYAEDAGELVDATGAAYAEPYQHFGRAATVRPGVVSVAALGGAVPGLVATVTVNDGARTWTLTRFIPEPAP